MRAGLLLPRFLLGFVLATSAAATSQEDYDTVSGEAFAAITERDAEGARKILERMRVLWPEAPGVLYNLPCLHASEGKPEEAFRWLDRAVELGYPDAEHSAADVDLEILRENPRFESLLERMRENAQAMRRSPTLAVRAALEERMARST